MLFLFVQVFEAVMTWTNHDLPARQEYVSELIEHVRLPLLTQEFLVQRVEQETLIKNNSQCKVSRQVCCCQSLLQLTEHVF